MVLINYVSQCNLLDTFKLWYMKRYNFKCIYSNSRPIRIQKDHYCKAVTYSIDFAIVPLPCYWRKALT
ncbi:hypothetical protein XELAEV_18026506mg [Xenopus laevis]|uniref:Uncharacterized protein n=1 Tax=Xenopus laevis TaxID=8355 RepID=A0A974HJ41_XENLA|nr:hypothetical protein XELAEV_18026506mg [Xenopus laevis]